MTIGMVRRHVVHMIVHLQLLSQRFYLAYARVCEVRSSVSMCPLEKQRFCDVFEQARYAGACYQVAPASADVTRRANPFQEGHTVN